MSRQIQIMTKQQDEMWIDVLKWMGWTQHANGHWYFKVTENQTDCLRGGQFPPPLTLDSLHEAEAKLTDAEHFNFRHQLKTITCLHTVALPATFEERENDRAYVSASPEQRLLALWRTIKA